VESADRSPLLVCRCDVSETIHPSISFFVCRLAVIQRDRRFILDSLQTHNAGLALGNLRSVLCIRRAALRG